MIPEAERHMQEAVRLSREAVRTGRGGPFGCVIVRHGQVVGRGRNEVTSIPDPTAHAEIMAIRDSCRSLGTHRLDDCQLYTSCEPCPMCLAAIYWARIPEVYFGNTRSDAAEIGFDDALIYEQIPLPVTARTVRMHPLLREAALESFREWAGKADKIHY